MNIYLYYILISWTTTNFIFCFAETSQNASIKTHYVQLGPNQVFSWWRNSVNWVTSLILSWLMNGKFPWNNYSVNIGNQPKTKDKFSSINAKPLFMSWRRSAFNEVNDWSLNAYTLEMISYSLSDTHTVLL